MASTGVLPLRVPLLGAEQRRRLRMGISQRMYRRRRLLGVRTRVDAGSHRFPGGQLRPGLAANRVNTLGLLDSGLVPIAEKPDIFRLCLDETNSTRSVRLLRKQVANAWERMVSFSFKQCCYYSVK